MRILQNRVCRLPLQVLMSAAGLSLLVACSTTDPVTGKKTRNLWSIEDDIKMGEEMMEDARKWAAQEKIPVNQDARMVAELERMMRDIAAVSHLPNLPYEVLLLHHETVNAMAMPGGKFIVFEGLYDPEKGLVRDRNELAAVMAHEIAHVNCRHSTETLTRDLPANLLLMGGMLYATYKEKEELQLLFGSAFLFYNGLVVTKYSRKDEREADRVGLLYMAQAGYDPRASIRLWRRAAEQEEDFDKALSFLSTHPPSSERAKHLEGRLPDAMLAYEESRRLRPGDALAQRDAPDSTAPRRSALARASLEPPGASAVSLRSQPSSPAPPVHRTTTPPPHSLPVASPRAPEPPSSTPVPAPEYRLEVRTPSVRAGEKIVVVHSTFPIDDPNAWIAFYDRDDAPDKDYLSYTFLQNLTDRTYDVVAPDKPGKGYHFRLFRTEAYDCTARSESVEVK